MTPEDKPPQAMRTSEPDKIRALAHPLRLRFLDILDQVGEATATECAQHTGETVANCSFHLRSLAKAGFIEPAPPRGREKPWRSTTRGRRLDVDPDNPASFDAIRELVAITLLREADRVREFMARQTTVPPQWSDTVTVTTSSFFATPDELRELVAEVSALTERFNGRQDPAHRPEGAVPAKLLAAVNPEHFGEAPQPNTGQEELS